MRALEAIAAMPDPAEVLAGVDEFERQRMNESLAQAAEWLADFRRLWEWESPPDPGEPAGMTSQSTP